MPQLEAMERAKYEEGKAVRHTVVNSTGSVLRSTHQEASKSQFSPSMYEDANARRTPLNYSTNPVSRGSPMLGRGPEGNILNSFFDNLSNLTVSVHAKLGLQLTIILIIY